jgi:hypothetical protein
MLTLFLSLSLAAPDPAIRPTMQGARVAVLQLQSLLASPPAFRDKANAPRIRAALDVLAPLQHFFANGKEKAVPSTAVGSLFAKELSKARADFDRGETEAARFRLRSITSLCLGCHLREPAESDLLPLKETTGLTGLERAAFLASTRQFKAAFAEWDTALAVTPKNDVKAYEQTEAIRFALSVAIVGMDDPRRAVALLSKHQPRADLPGFVTRSMALWLKEARAWEIEAFDASKQPPAALLAKARALMQLTGIEQTPTPDDNRLVSHLRAAAYLQEVLRRETGGALRPEALALLGVVSAATTDPTLWRLEWMTLESCIRENPKSAIARRCADRLSQRTYFAYTGRGGLDLPAAVVAELGELNGLAK